MSFWGQEVKPNKPITIKSGDVDGKLILTQATLGVGTSSKKSILQVNVGDESPVFLCSLLPEKSESCSLNLEFDEDDDVKFSVVGPTSIHISGFIQGVEHDEDDYDSDVYGEDIAEMESDDSEYDSEDDSEGDSIDSDDMMCPPSHKPNSGVVIEEIEDDEKPESEISGKKPSKKKKEPVNADSDKKQIVVKGDAGASLLESEDEDGFPVSSSQKVESSVAESKKNKNKNKKKNDMKHDGDSVESLKRKVDAMDQNKVPKSSTNDAVNGEKSENKKKNKKAKADHDEAVANVKQNASEVASEKQDVNKEGKKTPESNKGTKQSKDKPSKVRTFPNGFVIEELEMGKPNGRRASRGKKVSVHYTGKLRKTGKVFDSNKGRNPFKFRLGIGQVIKGWDVGVEGMRVGDKRRLIIPPSMGYGASGAPPQIPPNAWLVFDVELVDVA